MSSHEPPGGSPNSQQTGEGLQAWRSSGSLPASQDYLQGSGSGGVEREPHTSSAGAAGMVAAGGSQAGASDLSRLSPTDSHHSYVSHRSHHSRWSNAATVATTVAPTTGHRHGSSPYGDPPLREDEDGGSSGETTPVAAAPHSRGLTAAASGSASRTPRFLRSTSSPRHGGSGGSSRMGSRNSRSTVAATAVHPLDGTAEVEDGGDGCARLPPRLVVFHPDGESFGIGVDKTRENELHAAAAAAAAQRHRRQQRAAAVRLGPAGVRPPPGSAPVDDDGFPSSYAASRHIYRRQKIALMVMLLIDIVYLTVLLILRLVWGGNGDEPEVSTVVKFFIGSHPQSTSITYLAGSMFTDIVALYGASQEYPSIITLFIVWSVVLGAFAILEMPLLFMIMRLLLLIAAFQLRFSMSRVRHMLPPSNFGSWIVTGGRGIASVGGSAWQAAASPFRRFGRQGQQNQGGVEAAGSPSRRSSSTALAVPGSASAGQPQLPGGTVAQHLAAVRSSALFRAALLRMLSEQPHAGQPQMRDIEAGSSAGSLANAQVAGSAAGTAAGTAGTGTAASEHQQQQAAPVPVHRSIAAGGSRPSSGVSGEGIEQAGSLEHLYRTIMQDISAVAAAPTSSSGRRRQRQRQRAARARSLTGAGSSGGSSSRQRESSDREASSGGDSDDGGSALPETRTNTASTTTAAIANTAAASAATSAPAGSSRTSLAAAAAHRSAAGTGAPPTWQDLVNLLSYHSQQQQARRQQQQRQAAANAVPLVCLQAPPPFDAPGGSGSRDGVE